MVTLILDAVSHFLSTVSLKWAYLFGYLTGISLMLGGVKKCLLTPKL